jgi:hypothetical protein
LAQSDAPQWIIPRSSRKAAFALLGVVLVSMGLGGGAVAAAYQIQGKQNRDSLLAGFERRADLAREEMKTVLAKQQDTQQLVSSGNAGPEKLLGAVRRWQQRRLRLVA